MVGVTLESGFPARKFLEMAVRALGPTLLQALSERVVALAVGFHRFAAEGLTFAISCQVHDAKINAKYALWLPWFWGRNFQCHCQVECTASVDEISLPFDAIHAGFLIAAHNERKQNTARERQQRNRGEPLETHHPFVIDE